MTLFWIGVWVGVVVAAVPMAWVLTGVVSTLHRERRDRSSPRVAPKIEADRRGSLRREIDEFMRAKRG